MIEEEGLGEGADLTAPYRSHSLISADLAQNEDDDDNNSFLLDIVKG